MKTKIKILIILILTNIGYIYAQVGIGTETPDKNSKLEIESTQKGFLPPRMDFNARDNIDNPAEGLTIFNTDTGCLEFWNGSEWISACGGNDSISPRVSSLSVLSINNGGSNNTGTISVAYTGGNGANFSTRTFTCFGVTLTLQPGTLNNTTLGGSFPGFNGAGILTFTITGSPTTNGTLNCSISFGGQNIPIILSAPKLLNCSNPTVTGTLKKDKPASGISIGIDYSDGNGQQYPGQSIPSTGVNGLTANLDPGTLNNGNGTFQFDITGTPTSGGTADFNFNFGAVSCTFSVNVEGLFFDCLNTNVTGTLDKNDVATGVTATLNYFSANAQDYEAKTIPSTGVSGLTATLGAGTLANGNGTLTFDINGIPNKGGTAIFTFSFGNFTCNFTAEVEGFRCFAADIDINNVRGLVQYYPLPNNYQVSMDFSNGGDIFSRTKLFSSTYTLTAELVSDMRDGNGNGTVIYQIEGTPMLDTPPIFEDVFGIYGCDINLGGVATCRLEMGNFQTINAGGNTWMDRNLGATRVATELSDGDGFFSSAGPEGGIFQWGRCADGHEERPKLLSPQFGYDNQVPSSFPFRNDPWTGKHVVGTPLDEGDWLLSPNSSLWSGGTRGPGNNNPCPIGYRVPTIAELKSLNIQNSTDAFNILKLPYAGKRYTDGGFFDANLGGYYWSSSTQGNKSFDLYFSSQGAFPNSPTARAKALSIRCVQDF